MGYVFVTGYCFGCHKLFNFHPNLVPSVTVNGSREPICRNCVERVNPKRIANGLEPIIPHQDAYSACAEEEL